MKRSEAAEGLMMYGKLGPSLTKTEWKFLDGFVKDGFAASTSFGIIATAATPLALLTPTQFLCAQQLARSGEIGFNTAQKAHMDKLIENGWAMMDKHGSAWKATEKLIAAVKCWRESRGGDR